jgi:hypothetical protein
MFIAPTGSITAAAITVIGISGVSTVPAIVAVIAISVIAVIAAVVATEAEPDRPIAPPGISTAISVPIISAIHISVSPWIGMAVPPRAIAAAIRAAIVPSAVGEAGSAKATSVKGPHAMSGTSHCGKLDAGRGLDFGLRRHGSERQGLGRTSPRGR